MPRTSSTRQDILDLLTKHHMLTPKQLIEAIPSVNKTTIYRNLEQLVTDGKIKELRHQKDTVSFELTSHQHSHFICRNCEVVLPIEIPDEQFQQVFSSPLYSLENAHVDLHGLCRNCQTRLQHQT